MMEPFAVGFLMVFLSLITKVLFVVLILEILDRFTCGVGLWRMAIGVGVSGSICVISSVLVVHIWAGVYWLFCDMAPHDVVYFSATTFTSIGSPHRTMTAPWRLLEPLQSGVGMLSCGLDTAILLNTMSKLSMKKRFTHILEKD